LPCCSCLQLSYTSLKALDDRVKAVGVLHEFQSSDHKPLVVKFDNLRVATSLSAPATGSQYINVKYNWNSADIALYKYRLRNSLNKLVIPRSLYSCNYSCCNSEHLRDINKYYGSIMKCIRDSTKFCVPVLNSSVNKYNVPGWTDLVKDKCNK